MVILIDSNIVLDYMLKNENYYEDAKYILFMAEAHVIEGYVTASALTDIYYVARKANNSKEIAFDLIRKLIDGIHIATVNENIARRAVDIQWADFEDSIQYAASEAIFADYIVTRDKKGFIDSNIPVIDPKSLLDILLDQ